MLCQQETSLWDVAVHKNKQNNKDQDQKNACSKHTGGSGMGVPNTSRAELVYHGTGSNRAVCRSIVGLGMRGHSWHDRTTVLETKDVD
jgi:hypothetical protein